MIKCRLSESKLLWPPVLKSSANLSQVQFLCAGLSARATTGLVYRLGSFELCIAFPLRRHFAPGSNGRIVGHSDRRPACFWHVLTHLLRSLQRQNRARLLWSLLFFAIGPVLVLAGFGFVFLFVAALWAYYHLVKQHYGFMVLYKKKTEILPG